MSIAQPVMEEPQKVGGCLQRAAQKWSTENKWCYQTIAEGLRLKWKEKPPIQKFFNINEEEWTTDMVEVLNEGIEKGMWRELLPNEKPKWISKGFVVPKPGKKGRLVVNYAPLNQHLQCPHFKMEGWREVRALADKDGWMAKVDLGSAYYQIPLAKTAQQYLVFRANGKLWVPCGMPFGINLAPLTFTKVMKAAIRKIREAGIKTVVYLDDILILAATEEECRSAIQKTRSTLEEMGFMINLEKSVLKPKKKVEFLGFQIDMEKGTIEIPQTKKDKIFSLIKELKREKEISLKKAASILGVIKATAQALQGVHLQLFKTQRWLANEVKKQGWNGKAQITQELRQEMQVIREELKHNKASKIFEPNESVLITTDASGEGWGAWLSAGNEQEIRESHGEFPEEMKKGHSTKKELFAVLMALKTFSEQIIGKSVTLRSDCQTVVADINRRRVGSKKLLKIAKEIIQHCEKVNASIKATYIPGVENILADALSRVEDHHGLILRKETFIQLLKKHQLQIDCFATEENTKLKRFYSMKPTKKAEGMDFFAQQPKKTEMLYLFPPINQIGRTLRKIYNEDLQGVIIVPKWPSQPWWPQLTKLATAIEPLGVNAMLPTQAARELPKQTEWLAVTVSKQ